MIGVFDSGIGGLTILKYFLSELPGYDYIYLGDTARYPYGSRSQEVIYRYTQEAVDFLFSKGCKLIILACNTASAQALRKVQQEYLPGKYPDRRVLGVIRPLVEEVVKDEVSGVGVIGTKATVRSGVYEKEIKKLRNREIVDAKLPVSPRIRRGGRKECAVPAGRQETGENAKDTNGMVVFSQACTLLVPLVEEGWLKRPETKMILKKYLRPLREKQVEALILGCTHYPFLLEQIRRIMGKRCKVYNPGEVVARSLRDYLDRHSELGIEISKNPKRVYYTTDDMDVFREMGRRFLGERMIDVERVKLETA